MALTLNQVVQRLQLLALSHKQIKWFYVGDFWEFDSQEKTIDYPACFVEMMPGVIDRTNHQQRFNFKVWLLDLVKVVKDTEGNETEVISDMSSVAADFAAMLMSSTYQDDWEIAVESVVTPVTEQLGDMTAGVTLEIGIMVEFAADRCQVPADDVTFETDFDMARTRLLTYTGTGVEGSSFTVTDLAGKDVLAAYRAGGYRRIITTVPVDFDKIQVVGTDLGSRKGILSTTGVVSLSAGDILMAGEVLDFILWE